MLCERSNCSFPVICQYWGMPPFLVLGDVNIGGKTIRLFWRELPIQRPLHISFSPAAIRKACFQPTRGSLHCSRAVASSMNSMQVPGRHDWNQWNRRVPELFQSLSQHVFLLSGAEVYLTLATTHLRPQAAIPSWTSMLNVFLRDTK